MKDQINVGVVGCGYWGPNLVRNFRQLPDCNLKLMCDTSEQRLAHLKSLYPEVEGHKDFGHLLNGAELDAGIIATPVRFHYAIAKASLLAGQHTLIERAMAASGGECGGRGQSARAKGAGVM